MNIRYSQLAEFVSCPQSFYDRYILGKKDEMESSALVFGSALHLAIKTHFEGGDALEVFEMYWDSVKDKPLVYYRHGWQELRDMTVQKFIPNFIRLHAKKYANPLMEQQLSMPFLGEHTLQGTFDMLSVYDGVTTLSDWKTSTREYPSKKITQNPQMYIYAALCKHTYGELPKQLQYKVFVKADNRIQTLNRMISEQDVNRMMGEVENTARAMLRMIETKQTYHNHDCFCRREDDRHSENP